MMWEGMDGESSREEIERWMEKGEGGRGRERDE